MNTAPVAEDSLRLSSKFAAAIASLANLGDGLPRLQITDESSPSKPDNYRILPNTPRSATASLVTPGSSASEETSPRDISNVLEDWSGRGSHVEFLPKESIPLQQGRFLGHGSMGGVYEMCVCVYLI